MCRSLRRRQGCVHPQSPGKNASVLEDSAVCFCLLLFLLLNRRGLPVLTRRSLLPNIHPDASHDFLYHRRNTAVVELLSVSRTFFEKLSGAVPCKKPRQILCGIQAFQIENHPKGSGFSMFFLPSHFPF